MTSNDKIILDEILKARQAEVIPEADPAVYFELFTSEQILKDFDLSYDEIESGLIGGGGESPAAPLLRACEPLRARGWSSIFPIRAASRRRACPGGIRLPR